MKKKMFKRVLACVTAAAMVMSMAGCGGGKKEEGSKDNGTKTESGESKPASISEIKVNEAGNDATGKDDVPVPEGIQKDTVFRYWTNYDIPLYAPWMDNRAAILANQIYANLLVKEKGDIQSIKGNIAKEYKVSDDGLVWTFTLRDDVTFSDGCKLTSADFIATWDVMQTYQPRPFATVEKYEATGDYELVVTLKAPNPTFIYELPTQNVYGVVCKEELAKYGPEDNKSAVGCGSYTVESYATGEKFVLKAREDYWNEERAAHIETCEIVIIPDENTAMMGLMNGDIDCMNTVDIEVMNNLFESDYTLALIEDRENPFWLNARQVDVLKDVKVREALCHMIDWDAVSQLVYDGLYPHPNSYFTGDEAPEFSDKYTYDVEKGLALLKEANVKPEDIDFTILADPDYTNMCVAVVSQFNEAGLKNIDTVTYDGATCYGMLKSGTYDCFPVHNGYDPSSPLTPFTMGLLEGGTQPVMFLKDADEAAYNEAVKLYDKAATAPNTEDFYAAMTELENLVQEQCLALGGLQVIRGFAFADNIRGAYISPVSGELYMCYLYVAE